MLSQKNEANQRPKMACPCPNVCYNGFTMTLQQLKYALMVAETGTFNEASKQLYISQPSLSYAIKGLEDELGIIIFERSNKGTIVTEEGKEFLKNAKQVLFQFELLGDKYRNYSAVRQRFSISSQHYTFVSEAFSKLIKSQGDIDYEMVLNEAKTLEIIEDVKNLRSELGILYINETNETAIKKILKENRLLFTELCTTYPYILVGKDNPLALKDRVGVFDLVDYPGISFVQEDLAPNWFSEEVINILSNKKSIKISDRGSLADLLLTTDAYVVSTGIYAFSSDINKTVAIPLDTEQLNKTIQIGMIHHRDIHRTPIAGSFIEILGGVVGKYANQEHVKRYF